MKGSIQNEIIDVNWNDPTQVIAFYERNQIYFLNTTFNEDENEIEQITDIKISYVLALDERKYYSKAEPSYRKSRPMFIENY